MVVARRGDPIKMVTIRQFPIRGHGNRQLYVRLALSPEDAQRYDEVEDHWRYG